MTIALYTIKIRRYSKKNPKKYTTCNCKKRKNLGDLPHFDCSKPENDCVPIQGIIMLATVATLYGRPRN